MTDDAAYVFDNAQVIFCQLQVALRKEKVIEGDLDVRGQVEAVFDQSDRAPASLASAAHDGRFRCRPFERLIKPAIIHGRCRDLSDQRTAIP